MPICFAMAAAVGGWSPVTMITLMPADWHFFIAKGTVYFGGSIRETSPTKMKFYIGKLKLSGEVVLKWKSSGNCYFGRGSMANPRTLYPFLPNLRFTPSKFSLSSFSMVLNLPSKRILPQNFNIFSGAPLI